MPESCGRRAAYKVTLNQITMKFNELVNVWPQRACSPQHLLLSYDCVDIYISSMYAKL